MVKQVQHADKKSTTMVKRLLLVYIWNRFGCVHIQVKVYVLWKWGPQDYYPREWLTKF
jgi:hypothetical protein